LRVSNLAFGLVWLRAAELGLGVEVGANYFDR
jgi:hypothetical protein